VDVHYVHIVLKSFQEKYKEYNKKGLSVIEALTIKGDTMHNFG
jgi:hypothetical protein